MGRWGHRLFNGDVDMDIVSDVSYAAKKELADLIKNTNIAEHTKAKELHASIDNDEDYQDMMDFDIDELRTVLDAGLCDRLFEKYRTKTTKDSMTPELEVIILGMLMMRAGASIKADDIEYMRAIFPNIESKSGYVLPIFDLGFKDPGKAQAQAALEFYKNGVARDVRNPSCFKCGRIKCDLFEGETLSRCGRCKGAHYCGKTCQKNDWSQHKAICFKDDQRRAGPGGFVLMNC